MDIGSIAAINEFYSACQDFDIDKTRKRKAVLKNRYEDVKAVLKAELHRKAIDKQEYDELTVKCESLYQSALKDDKSDRKGDSNAKKHQ